MRVNHYYEDGTLYLGNKTETGEKVLTESQVELKTWVELERNQRIIAKSYWPHSMIPHPYRCNPVKTTKPWVRKC
jgi:hypothetical protein